MPLPKGRIWLDAQAAQDRVHGDRGIARYISEQLRALMALAPDAIQAVSLNAAYPLSANLAPVLGPGEAVLRAAGDRPPHPLPALYHVMSGFDLERSLDELWPEWARVPRVATVVTLFDLIPLVFEDHYLCDAEVRAQYLARADLVRAADHVLAISESSAADAVERLDVKPERITVIDAGVAGTFLAHPPAKSEAAGALRRRFPEIRDGFMLYVGGIEFRKNLERLIAAYGLMAPELRARHQLVITCKTLPEQRAHLERLAADAGCRRGELVVTGYVPDPELAELYRRTRLFVFASFYEGSGLPILEAMACGAPVAASNTSTSPEILGDREATFDPFDPQDIARVLSETVGDDAALARLRERSRRRAARYTWEHVGRRTLEGYERALAGRGRGRAGARHGRARLALLTPWPPEQSGVADYSARLAPALTRHADVDVVVDGRVAGHREPEVPGLRLVPYLSYRWWARALRLYDCVLYCMGNSRYHDWIYEAMMARPGVLVAHDVRLTGFYYEHARRERPEDFSLALMERIDAMYGDRLDASRWRPGFPTREEEETLGLYMTHEVQERAHAAVVHSRYAADVLRLDRPARLGEGPPVHVIPHAAPPVLPLPGTRDAEPLILSFGYLSYIKGLQTLLEAFAELTQAHPTARLVLAGDGEPGDAEHWAGLAAELGVGDRVEVPGYVSEAEHDRLVARASVGVQLREAYNGEASGSVARNLSAGLPTIVTDIGWFGELPRDAVVHVAPGVDASRLAASIDRLLSEDAHARAVARGARRHAEATSFPAVARRYVRALLPDPPRAAPPPLRPAPLTVVIPASNRCDRVLLGLEALVRQTCREFAVVVVDGASTDDTREEVERLAGTDPWRGRLRCVQFEGPPGYVARPRNIGARNAAPGSSLLLFADCDVLLVPEAIELMLDVHRRHPRAVLPCPLHWLGPLDLVDVEVRLRQGVKALMPLVPRRPAIRIEGTVVGTDSRGSRVFSPASCAEPRPLAPELAVGGLIAIPATLYEEVGGFDASFDGYGYEDMEMGVRLARAGAEAVATSDAVGLHVWHGKPDWREALLQNERNLDYLLRLHGLEATSDEWADWSVWWHYHAEREGIVVRAADGRLWAVDRGERVRLALPSEDWVARLGHAPADASDASPEWLDGLRDAGVARELDLERRSLDEAPSAARAR